MNETASASDRLDSWKAISDYLGRDVRTLQRWELQGLPVRRLAGGGRGSSVFAYQSEIDAWLKAGGAGHTPAEPTAEAGVDTLVNTVAVATPSVQPMPRRRWWSILLGTAVVTAALFWWLRPVEAPPVPRHVSITPDAVIASDARGSELWRHEFSADVVTYPIGWSLPYVALDGPNAGVIAATTYVLRPPTNSPETGSVYWFSVRGQLLRQYTMEGRWAFGAGREFGGPWALTTANPIDVGSSRRVVVSAHDYQWWPSVVTILDNAWRPQSSFVNSGWVYSTLWLGADRVVIAGFNQEHDGGMTAFLDANAGDGASSDAPAGPFYCQNCGTVRAMSYVVFPRSELNRVTRSAFNWANLSMVGGHIVARTTEVDHDPPSASMDAIYEFDGTMRLVSATYGDRYWDRHRALELDGKITHSRDQCPERDGPPFVLVSANGAPFTRLTVHR